MLVALIDGVEVVGTAGDGAEAVRLAQDCHPDVVLMDLRMPGTDGIAATADLRGRLPAARVLVLTTYADEDAIVPALQAGARGYLTKDASAAAAQARRDRARDAARPRRIGPVPGRAVLISMRRSAASSRRPSPSAVASIISCADSVSSASGSSPSIPRQRLTSSG